MKSNVVCTIFLAVVFVGSCGIFPEYDEYVRLFHKENVYSGEELTQRREIYYNNLKKIQNLNEASDNNVFGVNMFTDEDPLVFKRNRLLSSISSEKLKEFQPKSKHFIPFIPSTVSDDIPAEFDWRDYDAVTPVRDQGSVGSCWAFSTVENIEGQWKLKSEEKELLVLSPEQLVECDYFDCGVFGGWPSLAYEYIISTGGLQEESTYPYCSGSGKCYPCMANKNTTFCGPPPTYCAKNCTSDPSLFAANIHNWTQVPVDDEKISEFLVSQGPLSVLLNADTLQYYFGGIYDLPDWMCDPDELSHAVLLVGFGQKKSLLGKIEKYFIVKNSWGEKWGEHGYFKIMRKEGKGVCGINTGVTSSLV